MNLPVNDHVVSSFFTGLHGASCELTRVLVVSGLPNLRSFTPLFQVSTGLSPSIQSLVSFLFLVGEGGRGSLVAEPGP